VSVQGPLFIVQNLLSSVHGSSRPFLSWSISLLIGALWGWSLGEGGVKADGLTEVGGRLITACWGSEAASGGVTSRLRQGGVLTAYFW